jgi:hypothetical protein
MALREEHAFDKLWCNLERESEQKRHQEELKMNIQKKSENQQSRRKVKKGQRYVGTLHKEIGGLQVEDASSCGRRRPRRSMARSRAPPDACTFDPAASLSDLAIDDCISGVPGISGTALGLISDMHEPSRSCMKESTKMASKKRRPAALKAQGHSSSFNNKTALYRTLQSPGYSESSSDGPVQGVDRRFRDTKLCEEKKKQICQKHDELMTLKAVTLRINIAW